MVTNGSLTGNDKQVIAEWYYEKIKDHYDKTGELLNESQFLLRVNHEAKINVRGDDFSDCLDLLIEMHELELKEMGYEIKPNYRKIFENFQS